MILRAWKRFRPVNTEAKVDVKNKRRDPNPDIKSRTKEKKIQNIFGKIFTDKLMGEIRLRLYDFQETKDEVDLKNEYKE